MGNANIIVYVLLLLLSSVLRGGTVDLNDDVLGLIVFKSDLHDPPALSSWTEDDASPCNWKFIQCDPLTGRVSRLELTGLGLSGRLGRGLEKLHGLKVLSLSHNNLTGEISPELAKILELEILDLSNNKFSGQVPISFAEISSSLKQLDLSNNLLSGPLPDDIFKSFLSLTFLSLAGNALEGPIPSSLSDCGDLSRLNLSNNHFSGNPFAKTGGIMSLSKLSLLDLSNNFLSGSIPNGIFSTLHDLGELYLQMNQLSGFIPTDIGLCANLTKVDLSSNDFIGKIPTSFEKLSSLNSLSLANNKLVDDFPQWIVKLTNLQHLDMSSNSITGVLPSSIGDLKSLQVLILSNNKLTKNLPTSIVYCSRLRTIHLSNNLLNGSIPEGLFSMALEELDLSGNRLSETIPRCSSRFLESLLKLDLSRNDLIGDIPTIGPFSSLSYLNLSWNNLHSKIPPEIGYLRNVTVLDLRNSGLFGMIPGELCEPSSSLSILQLDNNALIGSIPQEIGNCSSLYLLSLSHNKLSGPIPSSMSMLTRLEILRLESNELTGEMPKELGSLQNLVAVNVSYNRLIGRLPPGGIFPSLDVTSLQGNLGLCSPLLKGPCKLDVQKPLVLNPDAYPKQMHGNDRGNDHLTKRSNHHQFFSISAITAISAAGIIILGVVAITLLNASARRKLDNALESIFSSSSRSATPSIGRIVLFDSRTSGNLLITNVESLINKASEIGEGTFGTVYKASLGVEGRIVAIKKLMTSDILQFPEDFDKDVRVLGKVRHPNLVTLRGYYWTPELQLLVSDYASNGSLQFRLHERPPNMVPLSWATRFKILLGTAKGLAHLHHSCHPQIIHLNLKPSNVLLDENYNAKISDYGLARLVEQQGIVSTRFHGAPGYVAPEIACESSRINEKCDVYGFGVLTLEMVTGRRAIEYWEDTMVMLNDHVKVVMEEGNALEYVDESMGTYPDEEVLPMLKLALVCTSQIPSSRPSMSEVVQILQVIKTPVPRTLEAF